MHFVARFVLLLLTLSALAPAQRYRLAIDPWIAWAPALVAQDVGFWKRSQLDVVVTSCAEGDAVQRFVAGKADFALMMAGTAVGLQASRQADLVVLAEVDWSHGGDKMLVKKGQKLAELKGKRLGIYEDSPAVMMFLAAKLKAEGLSVGDFKIVVVEDMDSLASQFVSGRLACAISYEPFVAQATVGGACEVIATTADFPGVMPECLVAHRKVYDRMSPEERTALLVGWIEAVEWCAEPKNEKEFARIAIQRVFAQEKVTPAEVKAMLANVRLHDRAALRERNLDKQSGIRAFLRDGSLFAGGAGGKHVDVEAMVDTVPLQQALAARSGAVRPAASPAR